jgi:hypothetical protein
MIVACAAIASGPALWVCTGEDPVMLTMLGVDDNVAVAARVLALLRPRLGPSAQPQGSGRGSSEHWPETSQRQRGGGGTGRSVIVKEPMAGNSSIASRPTAASMGWSSSGSSSRQLNDD